MVYRDNRDMSAILDHRARNELSSTEQKSSALVNSNTIAPELRLRSLRSQGPLLSEHQFRVKDSSPLAQPPLRFHSVTDKEKFIENHLPESKFNHVVFRTLDLKRSYLGKVKRSPLELPPKLLKDAAGQKLAAQQPPLNRPKPSLSSLF